MPPALNLFVDPAGDGPTNMAIDDCLLAAAAPTLRLYRWAPATLSLGYFQSFDDAARRDPALAAMPVVRRVTGGGAIVHADELTYSLALPISHPLAGAKPEVLYGWMHERIADAVAALGGRTAPKGGAQAPSTRRRPFLCFACHAPFDLMAGAEKLAGSAQRRTREALLQHGSVVLTRTHPIQPSGSINELIGRRVAFEDFADALINAVRDADTEVGEARPSEVDAALFDACRAKHAGDEWLRRR